MERPAPTVDAAPILLDAGMALDGAVLDVNFQDEPVYPATEALHRRGVPFAFTTGYEVDLIDYASPASRFARSP